MEVFEIVMMEVLQLTVDGKNQMSNHYIFNFRTSQAIKINYFIMDLFVQAFVDIKLIWLEIFWIALIRVKYWFWDRNLLLGHFTN